ncbi:PTS glucose transporter subunit IIA [Paenibacillus thermoaerophilus]|uniref:PTS glucose transporter subunit IIA n=1 Tax=Paenibacillus thermoaerophilus TaxID=1215385 RepID=A0ABW2UXZ1_9BACL|nr:PTS glucose transporter subunit IIA [Paenibacillus thermoaerophilus]TMV19168.1 PTS glucose transporter subunit IIA [Paenibacillus thermoaerophilus]
MRKWFSKTQTVAIDSPLEGRSVPLEQVPDEAFAQKMMGDGVAIEPASGRLTAPFDGKIAHLIDTRHAVIVEHDSGLQVLLHIGINTVALGGRGFAAHVRTGDRVRSGQLLIEFDPKAIAEAGFRPITPVVIANEDIAAGVERKYGAVRENEKAILKVSLKT